MEAVDLSGGWYHDGGHVKHALPTASAATMLLWGMIDYKDAYAQSNEFEFAKNQLKWIVDYYMKAHTGKFELYVQVCSYFINFKKVYLNSSFKIFPKNKN